MASYSTLGTGLRIVFLVLLVAVLIMGGLLWFDFLGLVDARQALAPVRELLGLSPQPTIEQVEDPLLLERERLARQTEALDLMREELVQRQQALDQREAEVEQMIADLSEQEKSLETREKLFNESQTAFEDRRVNLEQNSRYLVGMPPANAVNILLQMEDPDIIDLLVTTEQIAAREGQVSLVSFWLSQMPPERAAELQRKFVRRSGA